MGPDHLCICRHVHTVDPAQGCKAFGLRSSLAEGMASKGGTGGQQALGGCNHPAVLSLVLAHEALPPLHPVSANLTQRCAGVLCRRGGGGRAGWLQHICVAAGARSFPLEAVSQPLLSPASAATIGCNQASEQRCTHADSTCVAADSSSRLLPLRSTFLSMTNFLSGAEAISHDFAVVRLQQTEE